VKIADVQIRGMPEALLPGEPHCAAASVVIVESVASLLRTLHANQSWNCVVSSAVVDQLQHVDSLANLLSRQCRNSVGRKSDKSTAGDDSVDTDSSDKTVTVSDDVIEIVSKKDPTSGTFFQRNILVFVICPNGKDKVMINSLATQHTKIIITQIPW